MTSEYEAQAEKFLNDNDLALVAAFKGDRCPPWCGEDGPQCMHGDRYRVTIRRKIRTDRLKGSVPGLNPGGPPSSVSFDFWNSLVDSQAGERPTAYDVLACISSDAYTPETFADFCGEYGYDEDSRKALKLFKRCRKFADKLNAFFAPEEVEKLAEIQ